MALSYYTPSTVPSRTPNRIWQALRQWATHDGHNNKSSAPDARHQYSSLDYRSYRIDRAPPRSSRRLTKPQHDGSQGRRRTEDSWEQNRYVGLPSRRNTVIIQRTPIETPNAPKAPMRFNSIKRKPVPLYDEDCIDNNSARDETLKILVSETEVFPAHPGTTQEHRSDGEQIVKGVQGDNQDPAVESFLINYGWTSAELRDLVHQSQPVRKRSVRR